MSTTLDLELTQTFRNYLVQLDCDKAKAKLLKRLKMLEMGNWGDCKPVGSGVSELRIHFGPGYRIYCKSIGKKVVVLLGAGTKDTQKTDIHAAINLSQTL
ncbi:type II toxin-antitoxin system RelE/ParE family toxin [Delftia acidovorans]|uniref:type II toxin-antitoxin system RelE/ParE family toxin n=1 Tax=Delftia acidovorans TaxID=80866 RepID=UPI000BE2BDB6|nr:type II toxin-antitoxin system RelE/ParE family toxin [Delftia acidovorans]